jgi:hypothetical protein
VSHNYLAVIARAFFPGTERQDGVSEAISSLTMGLLRNVRSQHLHRTICHELPSNSKIEVQA